jgi:hypothetical protein
VFWNIILFYFTHMFLIYLTDNLDSKDEKLILNRRASEIA